MAAKSNPVFLELVRGLCFSVQGEALKISLAVQNGQLQLNPYLPFIAQALLIQKDSLLQALTVLNDRFFPEMQVDTARMERNLIASPALLNALLPLVGYHRIKELGEAYGKEPPENLEEALETLSRLTGMDKAAISAAVARTTLRPEGVPK